MSHEQTASLLARQRRARRVRMKVRGTADRPRLCVFRSLKHFSAQLIDDVTGRTLVSINDQALTVKGSPTDIARAVGTAIAEQAKAKGITSAVFDRGRYLYHGRVKAAADGARDAGLTF